MRRINSLKNKSRTSTPKIKYIKMEEAPIASDSRFIFTQIYLDNSESSDLVLCSEVLILLDDIEM
ncbi:hypothetical protein SS50377_27823 [Spironucleus salmonicida]|uniref:Uncharacterized protein n=1 Tax=Spironucleus salmonicida TaxID=348837 RepID=V6M651_9EUKA|nr:hypothetical protein SS50377_27823 [Spironucleus salmonicida]|eukprot:EST48859.1 Hypothetical protein SS50377_10957 [Spironucleus salmonicida]